jgi:hypothetical protein
MWHNIWEKLVLDPWWFAGGFVILLLLFLLFFVSFIRNFRALWWFYGAGVLCAILFLFSSESFLTIVEHVASYRPDWSLTYLVQTFTFESLITEFVFYLGLYGLAGVLLLLVLLMWSFVSFQWNRLKILIHRARDQSWFVLLFALLNISFQHLGFLLRGFNDLSFFASLFQFLLFLFLFQLFIRLVDSAKFHTSALFIEYNYAVGFLFLALRFLLDWNDLLLMGSGSIQELFLNHLFLFFFMLLLLGFFISSGIKAFFVSPFYLEQYFHRSGWSSTFLKFFQDRKKMYAQAQLFKGIALSSLIGFSFFVLLLSEMYLVLVFGFFFGFFGLFFVLDRQEDQRIRGDLVQKRVHSGHQKSFLS